MLKKLPIGIQTFKEIIQNDYLYVDKTQRIYELLSRGKTYFLSRPRRFGKSLLLDTIAEVFLGHRELFKGLWIDRSDWKWQPSPVIRLDMSQTSCANPQELKNSLNAALEEIAKEHGLTLSNQLVGDRFRELMDQVAAQAKQKVVILVDEYDYALLKHLNSDKKLFNDIRQTLHDFYIQMKANDARIRFVMLTGVSKFSQVSVFSGLNNLSDISMDTAYADICGMTQRELEDYFPEHIALLAQENEKSIPQTLEQIKHWYNGFRFSRAAIKVYNPFSTLLLFNKKIFSDHWFATGTPTFLYDLVRKVKPALESFNTEDVTSSRFSSVEIQKPDLLPIFFQTGYLTIADANLKPNGLYAYRLDFPNFEVENGFWNGLLGDLCGRYEDNLANDLITALQKKDLAIFFKYLESFFARVPHKLHIGLEKYYQSLFYIVFELLGLTIQTEYYSATGCRDAVIQMPEDVYIFEFKLFKSNKGIGKAELLKKSKLLIQKAFAQIEEKQYVKPFENTAKRIHRIAVVFEYPKKRNVVVWERK